MGHGLSISIIGRNEIDCQGLKRIFEEAGFSIDHCMTEGANLGIDRWDDDPHHLIVVDGSSKGAALVNCAKVRAALPHARLLLLSEQCEIETVKEAFTSGVDGVVAKDIGSEPLVGVVELISLGEKVFPSQLVDDLASRIRPQAGGSWKNPVSLSQFSEREIDILRGLMAGETNKIIGRRLGVVEATVKAHVKTILRKLQFDNRTQAAIWAVGCGLNPDETTTPCFKAPGAPRRNGHS